MGRSKTVKGAGPDQGGSGTLTIAYGAGLEMPGIETSGLATPGQETLGQETLGQEALGHEALGHEAPGPQMTSQAAMAPPLTTFAAPAFPVPEAQDEVAPLAGDLYMTVLGRFHEFLSPRNYFEIGTQTGATLALARCASVSVDPNYVLSTDVLGSKPSCFLFQTTSDDFFRRHDLTALLGGPVELAFLDGMHLFEFLLRDFINTERHCRPNSVILLHDCLPLDHWMAQRIYDATVRARSRYKGWWTGDVWKMVPLLRKHRPDLEITVLDAPPTGLVAITNLDPRSTVLADRYAALLREFGGLPLNIRELHAGIGMKPTSSLATFENMAKQFWL